MRQISIPFYLIKHCFWTFDFFSQKLCLRKHFSRYVKGLLFLLSWHFPAALHAQFAYTTNNGNLTITGYSGPGGALAIPGAIDGLPVTSIGPWAFYSTTLSSVLIPDTVTNIQDGAFFDCASLTNVTLGSNVQYIGQWAFGFSTNLIALNMRGNAPTIGGTNAFYDSHPKVYYLPDTTGWSPTFASLKTVLWNPAVPFGYTINDEAVTITSYTGAGGTVEIPSQIDFLPVTSIGTEALGWTSLVNVKIPDSVTNVAGDAFYDCGSLTNVILGNGVLNIGEQAFAFCGNLKQIVLGNGLQNIGDFAFSGAGLPTITIPDNVTNIGRDVFINCTSLTNVSIGNGVISIGSAAFLYCSHLRSLSLGDSLVLIGSQAFSGTILTNVVIPGSVTSIENSAFEGTSLTSMVLPSSITNVGNGAFSSTSLTNVVLSTNLTQIGNSVFANCSGIHNISIPPKVQSIGSSAFSGTGLTNINIPNEIAILGDSAFSGCSALTNITLPQGLAYIGNGVFSGTALSGIDIPSGVTNIGSSAFSGTPLTNITIPPNVPSIGDSTFQYCSHLTNIVIGTGVTSIGSGAFEYCAGLTSILLPEGIQNIGYSAFSSSGLTSIAVPDRVTNITSWAFSYMPNLTNASIGNGVSALGYGVFYDCPSLVTVTFGNKITNIMEEAFFADSSLQGIYFKGNAPILGEYAFSSGNGTVFYLPGTSGWDTSFAGYPAKLWNAHIMQDANFGVRSNFFGFNIVASNSPTVVVAACTNLMNPTWQPLQTNILSGDTLYFHDPASTTYPCRFYRVQMP